MKKYFLILIIALVGVLLWSQRRALHSVTPTLDHESKGEAIASSYWTCPMHPQIHSDKPGECPICHMKLVQVKTETKSASTEKQQDTDHRAEITVSPQQIESMGLQKYQVQKMDLDFHIPVSGRLLSSSSVAFQVYESDLRLIKTGLPFKGESSLFPESEISGTITSVDSVIDPTSRTVRVIGSLQKAPHGLLPETTFSGEVLVSAKGSLVVPESAVLHTGTGALVYLMTSENKLIPTPVTLGLKSDSYYQVTSGLEINQWISAGPNFLIDSEAKLRGTSGHSNH